MLERLFLGFISLFRLVFIYRPSLCIPTYKRGRGVYTYTSERGVTHSNATQHERSIEGAKVFVCLFVCEAMLKSQ